MLNAVNTVMDTHLLTPVGSPANPAARSESPIKRYLAAGKYRLYPFDHSAKPYFDEACARLNVALSDYSFANNVIWLAQASGFYQIIEGCFCLFALTGNGLTMLLPPLGEPSRQHRALKICVKILDAYNPSALQARLDFVYHDFLKVLDTDILTGAPLGAMLASSPASGLVIGTVSGDLISSLTRSGQNPLQSLLPMGLPRGRVVATPSDVSSLL